MTAIAIWLNEERPESPTLWVAADSRISGGSSGAPLIEDGAKLFPLPVVCRGPDAGGFFSEISYAHSFGYCFAGSTLMGQNAYLGLAPLLANLGVVSMGYVPSAADVADFVHRYLVRAFDDFKVTAAEGAIFEVAVFGYCSRTRGLKAFHIEPTCSGGVWTLGCSERAEMTVSRPLYLGSEKVAMMGRFAEAVSSAQPGRPLSRMPRFVIEDCISEGALSSIGGDVQLGIANRFGFRSLAVCKPRVSGEPEAYISYLGRELTPDLQRLGEAVVASPAIA